MKKYEGLFILNLAGKEEGVKEVIDKITEEIAALGGKVLTVQKMDRRPFSRVANRRINAGFYVNFIFESPEKELGHLKSRFAMSEEVFRVLFTDAPAEKAAVAA